MKPRRRDPSPVPLRSRIVSALGAERLREHPFAYHHLGQPATRWDCEIYSLYHEGVGEREAMLGARTRPYHAPRNRLQILGSVPWSPMIRNRPTVCKQLYSGVSSDPIPPNTDVVVSDPTHSVTREGEHSKSRDRTSERGAATNENKSESSWKSTAYASAKVVVDVVMESSDVFPPLKAAASGLAAILKHCDVCSAPPGPVCGTDDCSSKRWQIGKRWNR